MHGCVMLGVKVKYSTDHVVQHGNIPVLAAGNTRQAIHEFSLEPTERIVSATVRAGWMVDQLTFTTSQQRVIGPFGGMGGSQHAVDVWNQPMAYLAYLKGRVDQTQGETGVRHLEFVWAYYYNSPASGDNLGPFVPHTAELPLPSRLNAFLQLTH